MSPNFRNVALIAASLGLLVSLFVALREDEDGETAATSTAATTVEQTTTTEPASTTEPPTTTNAPTTTDAPATTAAPADEPATIRIAVVGGQPEGGIRRASVRRGRQVVLHVTADVSDHVHLHGYDLVADVAPAAPAQIRFRAAVPGRFEIELEDRGILIGDLEVRP